MNRRCRTDDQRNEAEAKNAKLSPPKVIYLGKRIGWLDSARMPSRIHRTVDEGITTVCGHNCGEMFATEWKQWILGKSSEIPRRRSGLSNFCKVCFKETNHNISWFE